MDHATGIELTADATSTTESDIRALFPGLRDTIYLNTATMACGCTPAKDAYARAVDQWTQGRFDWVAAEGVGEEVRALFAGMIGGHADEVALVPAVSAAAGIVAAGLPPARPGENIVVAAHEFSSNYFSWLQLKERGYDVRLLSSEDGALPPERYAAAADAGTRVIAVSAVQSSNGYRADLKSIGEIAKRSGAWFFVDGSQAIGAVPVDVVRDGIDFLAAVSYKFLLGTRGMGYLYVRRPLIERLQPIFAGWRAARKPFESFYGPAMELSHTASKLDGPLIWFAALAERETLGIFKRFGLSAIHDRNARLSRRLHEAVRDRLPAVRLNPDTSRSMIVSVPVGHPDHVMARFRDAGVVASMRAGRVRLAAHFYNVDADIDRAASLLAD